MNTREEWLNAAVDLLRPVFKPKAEIPSLKVSIGFPNRGGLGKRRVLGICCMPAMASDNIPQIYINPTIEEVGGADGILSVLVHELIHATGIKGHGKDFRALGLFVGLEGKMSSSIASASLQGVFAHIIEKLGSFPHAYLKNVYTTGEKQDKCRMFKCECQKCGYTVRISRKWIDLAIPECPLCKTELIKEEK